jgi:hypothetical protein
MSNSYLSENIIERMEDTVERMFNFSKSNWYCYAICDSTSISENESNTNGIFAISQLEFQWRVSSWNFKWWKWFEFYSLIFVRLIYFKLDEQHLLEQIYLRHNQAFVPGQLIEVVQMKAEKISPPLKESLYSYL